MRSARQRAHCPKLSPKQPQRSLEATMRLLLYIRFPAEGTSQAYHVHRFQAPLQRLKSRDLNHLRSCDSTLIASNTARSVLFFTLAFFFTHFFSRPFAPNLRAIYALWPSLNLSKPDYVPDLFFFSLNISPTNILFFLHSFSFFKYINNLKCTGNHKTTLDKNIKVNI